ncbi:alpha-dioxygenase 1-like [Magnolia sinica]|uniref:alpha-dioxygenase 1-like n=1 Tax=Magnolia sinica TaxID=86752 RepID=UPI0026581AFB|nr:alpha-dioxygenase 1-like [Magnolia sinica]
MNAIEPAVKNLHALSRSNFKEPRIGNYENTQEDNLFMPKEITNRIKIQSSRTKWGFNEEGCNSSVVAACLAIVAANVKSVIAERISDNYPQLEDEELYRYARLVTSAVIAKIHTIDWTAELLKMDTLRAGMQANWYGLLGKTYKDHFGHTGNSILSRFVGIRKPENDGVTYSLTEEFVSVYRMHSLLPDEILLRDIDSLQGRTSPLLSLNGMFIHAFFISIYIARYNQFRRNMLMRPIAKWEDLTNDKEAIAVLREVYGEDVESLDLLVGLMAEKKINGFAISETAFFIFLLMAPRRLKADRFFTSNFDEETYTKEGLKWVNTTESLKDVLGRHYPHMVDKWLNSTSAFSVWDSNPSPRNYIPIYLRIPR